jgi:hypothetical protein
MARFAGPGFANPRFANPRRIFSGVMGNSVTRTPHAS